MNSHVSDPCLVYKQNGHCKWWWGGGEVTRMIVSMILVPGSNPQNLDTIFLANLANFHVATILAISTYLKPNI